MKSKLLYIPSDSFALETELKQKKFKYMDGIYDVFKTNYVDNKIIKSKLKVFQFRGTNLIVILKKAQYVSNLTNLLDYYVKDEQYEKCELIKNIIANLKIDKDYEEDTTENT
jgi:hypothetical protein